MALPLSFLSIFSLSFLLLLLFRWFVISISCGGVVEAITFRCICCRRIRRKNPRVKNQKYCGDKRCQQVRKNKWQREKLEADSDYRADKRESQRAWREDNPDYWKQYRTRPPECGEQNRDLQRNRSLDSNVSSSADRVDKRSSGTPNKDALINLFIESTVLYRIYPVDTGHIKRDALIVKIIPVSTG